MFVDLECKAHKLLLPGQMLQRNVGASLVYHLTVQDFLFLRHFPLWVQKILAAAHTCHIFQQDDIDFFRDLYKGLFNGFDPQSAVSYEQMDIQLICLEAWLDIMQEATEHNSIKKRLTNELHSLHDRLEELSTTHSQREVRDMYILLLRRMDQYFRVVS